MLAKRDPRTTIPAMPAVPPRQLPLHTPPVASDRPAPIAQQPRARRRWRALVVLAFIIAVSTRDQWLPSVRALWQQPPREQTAVLPTETARTNERTMATTMDVVFMVDLLSSG